MEEVMRITCRHAEIGGGWCEGGERNEVTEVAAASRRMEIKMRIRKSETQRKENEEGQRHGQTLTSPFLSPLCLPSFLSLSLPRLQ